MNPVEFDGISLLIIDGPLVSSKTNIVARGIGEYDGESFIIVDESGDAFELPPNLDAIVAIPLTGKWKKKYPDAEFYLMIPKEDSAEK